MIIAEDGFYFKMSCEKCGAEIRKHKAYCTRYGEAYHFNPELKCNNCGFSTKVVYRSSSTSSSSSNTSKLNNNDDKVPCSKCNSTQITQDKKYSAEKAIKGVVLTKGIKAAKLKNKKDIDIEEESVKKNWPEFIKKRIDVKADTIIAANSFFNELLEEKIIHENTKMMIVTNFGVVEGTIKQEVDANDLAQQISNIFTKLRNNKLAKLENEVFLPTITNTNCFVTIFNAKVIPFSNPRNLVTFTALNLFSDQIVGFTLGEYQQL